MKQFFCYSTIAFLCLFSLSSCFTGVESTKKITMSKDDRRLQTPSPEESLLADIIAEPLSEWKSGKKFLATDTKINLILDAAPDNAEIARGDTLRFVRSESLTAPDGMQAAVVIFDAGNASYRLLTGQSVNQMDSYSSRQIPLLIDLDMIEGTRQILIGKQCWILSSLWKNALGLPIKGRKFVPVTITDVLPGDSSFPLKVVFSDMNGCSAWVPMNYNDTGISTRKFASLFSLTDIKEKYPHISPENWALIQEGRVAAGMTKEECRLSLGNPSDVNAGHDYSRTLEIWKYPDGSYLQFADGLLLLMN